MTKSGKIVVQRKNRYIIIFILFVILLLLLFFFRYEKKSYITFPGCFVTTEYSLYHIPFYKKTVPNKYLQDFISRKEIKLSRKDRFYYPGNAITAFRIEYGAGGTGHLLLKLTDLIRHDLISDEDAEKIILLLDNNDERGFYETFFEGVKKM